MSKFDLRDISDRLTHSADTDAVVFEFIGYLQSAHPEWRAALAFYEVSHDALVNVYERHEQRLVRRDVTVSMAELPPRLVRKLFHPGAYVQPAIPRSAVTRLLQGSPHYEPDPLEAPALRALVPIADWQSCVCLPLADHEDVLALLVLASERRNAFGSRQVGEILSAKSIAALALAQHLRRGPASDEVERVKAQAFAQHSDAANAYTQLAVAQTRLADSEHTVGFMRDVFHLLAQEHDPDQLAATMVTWFCEHFRIERCSLMLPDANGETLTIAAQHGIDARVAREVKVRVGQGIAGWVAHNRKPLFVRVHTQDKGVPDPVRIGDAYNSDSFISTPLVYNNRLLGVLNLSNRKNGEPFVDGDLDRANIVGSLMAVLLGSHQAARRAAWV